MQSRDLCYNIAFPKPFALNFRAPPGQHQKTVDVNVGKALGAPELGLDLLNWASVTEKLWQHQACSCLDILFVIDKVHSLLSKVC